MRRHAWGGLSRLMMAERDLTDGASEFAMSAEA
jgi:hypothetical protein